MGVQRTKPKWREKFEWRHRGRMDVWGTRVLTVEALHSHNEDGFDDDLPNEITVDLESGMDMGGNSHSTIRMDREAAEALISLLQEALAWDGT